VERVIRKAIDSLEGRASKKLKLVVLPFISRAVIRKGNLSFLEKVKGLDS
jgi:hypothetical protein